MQIPAINPSAPPVQLAPEQLAGNNAISEKEKISELCRQFEAVLARQLLKQSSNTVFKSDFTDDDASAGIYRDMIDEQLAESISRSGALGIGRSLQSELTRQIGSKEANAR